MSAPGTPLLRAERFLQKRLTALEGRLPLDGQDSPLWAEYVQVADTLARIRAQLYPTTPTSVGPAPQRPRRAEAV